MTPSGVLMISPWSGTLWAMVGAMPTSPAKPMSICCVTLSVPKLCRASAEAELSALCCADDTADLRVNMTNWVSLNMSTHLALKVSLQWLYDHQPALKEVDLFAPPGPPTVTVPTQKVVTEVDNLDSIFTTALVIKY